MKGSGLALILGKGLKDEGKDEAPEKGEPEDGGVEESLGQEALDAVKSGDAQAFYDALYAIAERCMK